MIKPPPPPHRYICAHYVHRLTRLIFGFTRCELKAEPLAQILCYRYCGLEECAVYFTLTAPVFSCGKKHSPASHPYFQTASHPLLGDIHAILAAHTLHLPVSVTHWPRSLTWLGSSQLSAKIHNLLFVYAHTLGGIKSHLFKLPQTSTHPAAVPM